MTTPESKASKRKPWWLLAIALVVVGGMIAIAVGLTAGDEESAGGPSPGSIGDPEIRQAKWRISSQRAPGKRLSKHQRAVLRKQKKKLNGVTREVFDALFLSPELLGKALRTSFSADARKSYQRAGAGVPEGAEDVQIRRRSARIVIESNSRATINVRIIARGRASKGEFATEHHSVLYAARRDKGWKVFGFVMDQKPFKKKARSRKDDGAERDKKRKSKAKKPSRKTDRGSDGKKNKKRSGGKNRRGDR